MITDIESFYENYFRDLAIRSYDIGHTDAAPKFWINTDIDSLSEVNEAVTNELRFPCLILDTLEFTTPVGSNNVRERVRGAFTVLLTFEQGSSKSLKESRAQARNIATKLRNHLIRDSKPSMEAIGNPDSLLNQGVQFYEDIEGDYTRPVAQIAVGFFYEFTWEIPADLSFGQTDFSAIV